MDESSPHKLRNVRITYDHEVDAAMIYLVPIATGEVADTVECGGEGPAGSIYLDLDKDGRLLGIEVLRARETLPDEVLAQAERI
jgi:uncharacterized protein YuzE